MFPKFDVFEDILCLILMKSTTIIENIFKSFLQCTDTIGIDLTELISVITVVYLQWLGKTKVLWI